MKEPRTHMLKIELLHLRDLISGDKKAEILQNDRGYRKGDTLSFNQGNPLRSPEFAVHASMEVEFLITHILHGWGLHQGFVMLSVHRINK